MLRKKFKKDTTLLTNMFLGSEDGSSDREFVFSKTLDIESLVNINGIVDFESAEFKPNENKLEIDLFFLKYIEDDEVDTISSYLNEGRTINDMSLIIACLLRAAIAESISYKDLPYKIIIKEYTDIAREFSSQMSEVNFVNSILDKIMKKLNAQ